MKEIQLTKGYVALVDDADYVELAKFKWCAVLPRPNRPYAMRTHDKKVIYMHRELMGFPDSLEVDHVNGDTLDNRRNNLRTATRAQNSVNRGAIARRSGQFKGVYRNGARKNPYKAMIRDGAIVKHLGTFPTAEAAARVYDRAALKIHGAFARLNFFDDRVTP